MVEAARLTSSRLVQNICYCNSLTLDVCVEETYMWQLSLPSFV